MLSDEMEQHNKTYGPVNVPMKEWTKRVKSLENSKRSPIEDYVDIVENMGYNIVMYRLKQNDLWGVELNCEDEGNKREAHGTGVFLRDAMEEALIRMERLEDGT